MEVRDEPVHGAKRVAWPDEQIRFAGRCVQPAVRSDNGFQSARRGRSDRPDLVCIVAHFVEGFGRGLGDFEILRVHHVLRGIFDFDGLERSRSHVEQQVDPSDSARLQGGQEFRSEMESGGWRGDRTGLPGVHGLVSLGVRRFISPVDIWRKRDVAVPFDRDFERFRGLETHNAGPASGDLLDDCVETWRDMHHSAGPQLSAWMHERFVLTGLTRGSEQKHFGRRARVPLTEQPRAEDPRRIQDDGVTRRNENGKIRKVAMLKRA